MSSAIATPKLGSKDQVLALEDKTSGLWVSAAYDLRTLCKTYLEMRADLNLVSDWHEHPKAQQYGGSQQPGSRVVLEEGLFGKQIAGFLRESRSRSRKRTKFAFAGAVRRYKPRRGVPKGERPSSSMEDGADEQVEGLASATEQSKVSQKSKAYSYF